ncbi:MAG: CDP-diacylglycerol--serine O-phosphatidyltransferase [Rhodospirillales bacterium RIFCSPLOWO2_12_FULL_58_28]|nr:MAG: CDP-diacylglycerol--serine O-phosphatidyltransferase [Rhodospirillales bacterium RIFCSPLOWO2_02_FULL_58_16]OHC77620.1 MAG: CDP-diacylglycerol--serine O-phosphatidyltransferase [Rhodospirillales bacterium RIFCSPLOWO2_12_FULL_58_28]
MARRPRRPRLKGLPFNRMIPNILTLMAMCSGLTAIRFAIQDRWEHAVLAIVVAAILDALDGRVARILKGTSKFGAELDSLADFVSFGVAPAIILYLWTMKDAGRAGWLLVMLFCVCCVLRLARFNTNIDEPGAPPWSYNFFTGVPTPAGAGLVLLPLIFSLQLGDGFFRQPWVTSIFLVTVAGLLVSRIPTFAFKKFKVPIPWVLPMMLIVGLVVASLASAPWATLSISLSVYLVTIPFSVRAYASLQRQAEDIQGAAVNPADGDKSKENLSK